MANALRQRTIRIILFDADKTLYDIDTTAAYSKMYVFLSDKLNVPTAQLQKEHKEKILTIKESLDPVKRDYRHTLEILVKKHTKRDHTQIIDDAYQLFWNEVIEQLQEKKGAKEMLQKLSKKYILAIATDEFLPIVERKLNRIFGNWKDYFHTIISSDKVNSMKPSPTYYVEAMNYFKVAPEQIVMIGDSWKRDLAPAKDLGIATILVSDKKEGEPDIFIKQLAELETVLDSE